MIKKLYNLNDLDQTHLHITKKILFTSQKPQTMLLSMMQKRNSNLQTSRDSYGQEFCARYGAEYRSVDARNSVERQTKKKRTEFGISRGRLEVISNLLKTEKTRKTMHEESVVYDKYMRKKRSRKEFPLTKFNLSDPLDNEEDSKSGPHLPSENSEKENKEKIGVYMHKIRPFDIKADNGALNTIRYSTLLRTINNDKLYQNYSTKLPQISMTKKHEFVSGKGVFKRVQFA